MTPLGKLLELHPPEQLTTWEIIRLILVARKWPDIHRIVDRDICKDHSRWSGPNCFEGSCVQSNI